LVKGGRESNRRGESTLSVWMEISQTLLEQLIYANENKGILKRKKN
jgi:hypothetical protein